MHVTLKDIFADFEPEPVKCDECGQQLALLKKGAHYEFSGCACKDKPLVIGEHFVGGFGEGPLFIYRKKSS